VSLDATLEDGLLPPGLGGARPVELPATRYKQGGRQMYHVVVTLANLTTIIVKRPDPNQPIEGNRKVDAARAKKFGDYILKEAGWVSPAIIVRVPSGEVKFKQVKPFEDGTAWGVLTVPLHVLTEILLLDGQHRTLGTFLGLDEINGRISRLRDLVSAAERTGEPALVADHQKRLQTELATRDRLGQEHISIDVAVVSTGTAKQMFADINNNAKGVNPDYKTVLDQRDVVNRITIDLINDHPLLTGRVEHGQATRMSVTNPNLIGAKSVADIVRAVHKGTRGRMGRRIENEMEENQRTATAAVSQFLDLLLTSFDDLRLVSEGRLEPVQLRKTSMLGSATMLRVLAAVYHELLHASTDPGAPSPLPRSSIQAFFTSLDPHMKEIPVAADNEFWMSTGAFLPDTSAPQARRQTIEGLVDELVQRARKMNPRK
jgi:DNA-sulfur modification-associated